MAKTKTTWSGGTSGNPKGRPKGTRSLTELLRKAGQRMIYDDIGNYLPANEILAKLVWDLVVRGQVSLSGNTYLMRSAEEWLQAVKWVYAHMDGDAALEAGALDAAALEGVVKRGDTALEAMVKQVGDGTADEGEALNDEAAQDDEALAVQRLSLDSEEEQRIVVDPLEELKHLVYVPPRPFPSEEEDKRRRGRQDVRRWKDGRLEE